MSTALILAAGTSALAAIVVDRGDRRPPAFFVLKPLTTVLIIVLAWLQDPADASYRTWILAGLGLSLLGDIALMFHGQRWFLAGLGSFLLAHLAFIAALTAGLGAIALPWWSLASPLAALVVLPFLWRGAGALRVAVIPYGVVLCAMVLAAAARYHALPSTGALLAVCGAASFQLSDSVLGWRQFVRPFPLVQPLILSTYWLGIGLMALSV